MNGSNSLQKEVQYFPDKSFIRSGWYGINS